MCIRDRPRSVPIEDSVLTTDPQDILQDSSIELIAEFMGGLEPVSYTHLDVYKRQAV